METAKLINEKLKVKLILDSRLRERNWGNWTGKTWDEISKILDLFKIEERYKFIPKGGESWEEMDNRLIDLLTTIKKTDYRTVAIITHEGILRTMVPIIKNTAKAESLNLHFTNGSFHVFNI